MEVIKWLAVNGIDLGVIIGLVFTAHSIRKETEARKIGNLIALAEHHHSIWKDFYSQPSLSRIFAIATQLHREMIHVPRRIINIESKTSANTKRDITEVNYGSRSNISPLRGRVWG